MYSIIYNNKNSQDDLGLSIEKRPNIPFPQKRIERFSVPGRNGSITIAEGTYEDIPIEFLVGFMDYNFFDKLRPVKEWILVMKDYHLTFSDDVYNFYKVKSVEVGDIERELRRFGKFNLQFLCDPFLYSYEGEKPIEILWNTTLYNDGYESNPYIKIYGNGNVSININDNLITLNNIVDFVEIDTESMNCFKGNILKNNTMMGDFPVLKGGENTISFTGATKLEITPNWRCL